MAKHVTAISLIGIFGLIILHNPVFAVRCCCVILAHIHSVIIYPIVITIDFRLNISKGQILRPTPNTAPLICGACYNTQPEDLLTMA